MHLYRTSKKGGCREYNDVSRRAFLQSGAAAMAALIGAPAWLPRVSYAQSASSRDVLVSVYLRGGADGLTLCVPHGDPEYYAARPTLAVPRPDSGMAEAATDLDGFFGLPPALTPLLPAYDAGNLLIVHACGSTDGTRSHFDAMRFMEVGKARDSQLASGWLGRHLATTPAVDPNAGLRGLGIADGLQLTLAGAPRTLPIPNPAAFAGDSSEPAFQALMAMYGRSDEPLRTAAEYTQRTVDLLSAIDFANYQPGGGANYGTPNEFSEAMRATAALIRADTGVEAVAVDLGGWDTHDEQGERGGGQLGELMSVLGNGLAGFHADVMADAGRPVTVVVISEFGRVVFENGSAGTDHGYGNALFVMSAAATGGRVLADWPGLAVEQRYEEQDLEINVDYRDILAEVMQKRCQTADLSTVFPDYTPNFRGVVV